MSFLSSEFFEQFKPIAKKLLSALAKELFEYYASKHASQLKSAKSSAKREKLELLNHLSIKDLEFAIEWLYRYGYLDGLPTIKKILEAVRKLQKIYDGLKADGIIGERTLSVMTMRRCGCPDIVPMTKGKPKKLSGGGISPWGKREIRYAFLEFIPGFSKSYQEKAFQESGDAWSEIANFKLIRVNQNENPDIVVGVGRGRRDQFDGRGGTLAYTYLRRGWNIQERGPIPLLFDVDENWSTGPSGGGIWYLPVATHELGHVACDLEHSNVNGALMFPTYNPAVSGPVQPDDKSRAIKQFGKSKEGGTVVTPQNGKATIIIPRQEIVVDIKSA